MFVIREMKAGLWMVRTKQGDGWFGDVLLQATLICTNSKKISVIRPEHHLIGGLGQRIRNGQSLQGL